MSSQTYRRMLGRLLATSLLPIVVLGCGAGAPGPERATSTLDAATDVREDRGCVEIFDPEVDLFPTKAEVRWAKGFSVEYRGHYKILDVHGPPAVRVALVRGGAPAPDLDIPTVEIPVRSVATASTTELLHFEALDVVERWVAHANLRFVSSERLRGVIDAGSVVEVGGAEVGHIDVERLLEAAPSVLFVDSAERATGDSLRLLGGVGTAAVPFPSYLEEHPLGRTEWLLATSLFFDREAEAIRVFGEIESAYLGLKNRVAEQTTRRPTVLTNGPWQGVWYVPAGQSFIARLLADAGAAYLWADAEGVGTLQLDIEAVYSKARDADYWFFPSHWRSLGEIASIDSRLATFGAFDTRQVYAADLRVREGGGNDYWELGVFRPDLVLADLAAILHPEVLPDHTPTFLRRLDQDPP
ncbi:MAG: ABC transporter substrate-binding protein [Acidobacteriota bacterium]